MYYTNLPDHKEPGFDEQLHFSQFRNQNIIFNALASKSVCENHVGCLSFKTVMNGEEWYGINNHRKAVRFGQFLILNDDQTYSSSIDMEGEVRSISVFFRKEFATAVFHDAVSSEETLLDTPFDLGSKSLEFFQTLYAVDSELQQQLIYLLSGLNNWGYDSNKVDEHLTFLLNHVIRSHKVEKYRADQINAIKPGTRTEIYKRLCIAKDLLHSTFNNKLDLSIISNEACLSTPQLIRQFKAVFQTTPHQYLTRIRLAHAAKLLKQTKAHVNEITLACGFEDASAFGRAFKMEFGVTPLYFRG